MTKKALHFGAGNIGRGFIGKIIAESGYHVTFADVNEEVIKEIEKLGSYKVDVVGSYNSTDTVSGVNGILVTDENLAKELFNVEIITTAVGVNILPRIAKQIAQIIRVRKENSVKYSLHIIACENTVRGTTKILMPAVFSELDNDEISWCHEHVNFVDSAVDRIVPVADKYKSILAVTVETFFEWDVDKYQFKNGDIPYIQGMTVVDNLGAYVERKLFTLNTAHACTAYIGVLKGKKTIFEAINDNSIEKIIRGVMQESSGVLERRFGFTGEELEKYQDSIIARFKNKYIIDDLMRVGREPIRKLGSEDRLIKPLKGTIEYGTDSRNLQMCIGAAFAYKNPHDMQANELQKKIAGKGIENVVREYVDDISAITNIVNHYKEFTNT